MESYKRGSHTIWDCKYRRKGLEGRHRERDPHPAERREIRA
jgi:hypothetical protein